MITVQTPQDSLSTFALSVFRIYGLLLRNGDKLTKELGQSSARWQVLGRIGQEPQTVAGIAKSLGHARQSVQRLADTLVKDELATYTSNPAHKRAHLLALTPKGAEVLTDIYAQNATWVKHALAKLGERQLMQLACEIEQIATILEADE